MGRTINYTCDDCHDVFPRDTIARRALTFTNLGSRKMIASVQLGYHCVSCAKKRAKQARERREPAANKRAAA